MVKIVSVSPPMFTPENVPKNDFDITTCQLAQSCVNGVCISQNRNNTFRRTILARRSSAATCITHYQCIYMERYKALIINENRFFQQIGVFLTLLKPHMFLKLVTSIRFQKNLRTSTEKLTYDNSIYAKGSKISSM